MKHPALGRRQGAFTLIELLVVMALVAVLARIAAPSMRSFASNQALSSVTSDLMNAAVLARNTAVSRNARTVVQPVSGTDWGQGWRVYIDKNGNSAFNSGTDELVSEREAIPADVRVMTSGSGACTLVDLMTFGPDGFLASTAGGVAFDSSYSGRTRCVVLTPVGRPRTCGTGGGATAC